MRCAVAQVHSGPDVDKNLTQHVSLIQEAAKRGASLVLFPEVAMAATFDAESTRRLSQPLGGSYITGLREAAKREHVTTVTGLLEKTDAGVYNTEVVIDANGEIIRTYRKVHLFDALRFRESDMMNSGSEPFEPFNQEGFTFGLVTCYELRFPEWIRQQALAGAKVLLMPAAWAGGPYKDVHWTTLARARAIENTCYVLASCMTGPKFNGHSQILDPFGRTLAECADEEGLIVADVTSETLAAVEELLPWRSHRHPDLYQL